jgi:hypothetical protein
MLEVVRHLVQREMVRADRRVGARVAGIRGSI